tara:strand:- start:615 stop:1838 length:1224 start_codon:yes stop_codon:yes gene_type:complete
MTTLTKLRKKYKRPKLYGKQEDAIFNEDKNRNPINRFAIIEASTKSGKTQGCIVWLMEQAMRHGGKGKNYWWIAPIYSQAEIAFRRLKTMQQDKGNIYNNSNLSITIPNGAMVWFKGGDKPDSLYGEDVHAAVIDEASRCKEEVWAAVRSTITATQAPVRIIGNVKGRKNWAYQLARKAKSGLDNWHYSKITAKDAVEGGILQADEVEEAKRDLPQNVFQELYMAEPSDDEGNPFGVSAIYDCVKPMSNKAPVVWGWDLAKSTDYTWGVGIDEDGNVCRSERFQNAWEITLQEIKRLTGDTPALIDSTGVGDAIMEFLAKAGNNYTGFKFTSSSKQQLMERLSVAIQQKQITYPEGLLLDELLSFEYVYTRTGVQYSAPSGLHDDGVCALALAVYHLNQSPSIGVWL